MDPFHPFVHSLEVVVVRSADHIWIAVGFDIEAACSDRVVAGRQDIQADMEMACWRQNSASRQYVHTQDACCPYAATQAAYGCQEVVAAVPSYLCLHGTCEVGSLGIHARALKTLLGIHEVETVERLRKLGGRIRGVPGWWIEIEIAVLAAPRLEIHEIETVIHLHLFLRNQGAPCGLLIFVFSSCTKPSHK